MASRRFYQFTESLNASLVYLQGTMVVGSTGAVGTVTGSGISSVTRLAVGTYQVNFSDNYFRYLTHNISLRSGVVTTTAITALTPGLMYTIKTLGAATTAQWVTAGVPVGTTPAVGVAFLAAATSAGTNSDCYSPLASLITNVEVLGNPQVTIINQTGPYIVFQTMSATSSSVTTPIPIDPAATSVIDFGFFFRNSTVKGTGE